MFGNDDLGDLSNVSFRDVLGLLVLSMIAVIVLLLTIINDPGEEEEEVPSPGNLSVEIFWDRGDNIDVDLWVAAPGERAVGYSHRSSRTLNLLRDDLGHLNDDTPINYEVIYSRGLPAGEYIANIHLFSNGREQDPPPYRVQMVVTLIPHDGPRRVIFNGYRQLERRGQEITFVRFRIDDDGGVVPDSIHDRPTPVRRRGAQPDFGVYDGAP